MMQNSDGRFVVINSSKLQIQEIKSVASSSQVVCIDETENDISIQSSGCEFKD